MSRRNTENAEKLRDYGPLSKWNLLNFLKSVFMSQIFFILLIVISVDKRYCSSWIDVLRVNVHAFFLLFM